MVNDIPECLIPEELMLGIPTTEESDVQKVLRQIERPTFVDTTPSFSDFLKLRPTMVNETLPELGICCVAFKETRVGAT